MAFQKNGSTRTGTDSAQHSSDACWLRLAAKIWPILAVEQKLMIIETIEGIEMAAKQKAVQVKKLTPADQIKALAEVNQADELLARHGVGLTPAHFRKAVKAILK